MKPQPELEIVSATLSEGLTLLVDFSDGTSAFFSANQLVRIAANRMATAYWPAGRQADTPRTPARAPRT